MYISGTYFFKILHTCLEFIFFNKFDILGWFSKTISQTTSELTARLAYLYFNLFSCSLLLIYVNRPRPFPAHFGICYSLIFLLLHPLTTLNFRTLKVRNNLQKMDEGVEISKNILAFWPNVQEIEKEIVLTP